jgi:hypothetical protein
MKKLMDRDILTALVLFLIGAVALAKAGSNLMDWVFPLMAAYFILFAAAVLVASVVFAAVAGRVPDIISVSAEDRIVWLDVFTFLLIALGYLLVMYGLGFWLSSFLMLSLVSIYLTQRKTRHNVALAIVVPLATCVVAYIVFLHVFYVPLPTATWWPGVG